MPKNSSVDVALSEFIEEAQEIVQRFSEGLGTLESSNGSAETVNSLYRDMHTMKGSAMLFGYGTIGRVAHAMEACLDPLRKHRLVPSSEMMNVSLRCLDLLDRMIKSLSSGETDASFSKEASKYVAELLRASSEQFGLEFSEMNDKQVPYNAFDSDRNELHTLARSREDHMTASPRMESQEPNEKHTESAQAVAGPLAEGDAKSELTEGPVDTSIRVQVSLLDRLMALVGELVLIRNQFIQYKEKSDDLELLTLSKSLDMVTSDLQGEVMKTRMQPIGRVTTKFKGLVKEIAKDLKKKVDLTLHGSETELDKSLLEAIKDPLTHIVRNSCDHGVEGPEERKKLGKPDTGHLMIRSLHEGGQVVIEISDDGRGLNRQKISEKALKLGLFQKDVLSRMSDREVFGIIFLPGFSTADQVTSVSGRGFGMNVVKNNVERIGGNVEIQSSPGKGTTIRLKIPLTLAIVPSLLIRSAGQRFAIPQVKLVELVRVDSSSGTNQIEYLEGMPMYRLRGDLLPLIDLRTIIKAEPRPKGGDRNLVVLNAEGEYFGLIVDEILDTADIVVKPLNSILKSLSVFSGATIMGDGSVALILDIIGIAPGIKRAANSGTDDAHQFSIESKRLKADALEFLVLKVCSKDSRTSHAVPLCLVHRLEEFRLDQIEYSGSQKVVRYRDALLPLIPLGKIMGYPEVPSDGRDGNASEPREVFVVVIEKSNRFYGIEVAEIADIVTVEDQIDDSIRDRVGTLGNLIYQNHVIVVIDVLGIIEIYRNKVSGGTGVVQTSGATLSNVMNELKLKNLESNGNRVRILYAEDVAFFRKQVSMVLSQAGYEVTTVEDGQKALEVLEASPEGRFNLLLSDIEMPNMTGHELARSLRKKPRFKDLPMIALTTRYRDKDILEGKQAGFQTYLEKLNTARLLDAISTAMGVTQ